MQEDDGMQWDIEDEDQDEIKRQKIQSKRDVQAAIIILSISFTFSVGLQRRVF